MGDRAFTTVFAWPYPGRDNLPAAVLNELHAHDQLPVDDTPLDEWYGGDGTAVLAGDQQTGLILAIADQEANYGTGAYSELIAAFGEAGLQVYAGNDAGGDYGASWEYHPADRTGELTVEWRRWNEDEFVVGRRNLLTDGRRTLSEIPDQTLAAAVRRLLLAPTAVPDVVLKHAQGCF